MFDFLGKYFWAIAIALTLLNYRWKTANLPRPSNGDSPDNGLLLYRRAVGLMIAPWLIMGVGILFGGVPGVWNYFRPQDLNPYVWAWYLCLFMLACGFAYWVLFRGGARRAVELQLAQVVFLGKPMQMSEQWIRVYAAVSPLFIILWVWLVWHMDARVPGQVR
jgi:hypothetical protein